VPDSFTNILFNDEMFTVRSAVSSLAELVVEVRSDDEQLQHLADLDMLVRALCGVRDELLARLRDGEHSWTSIADVTGVPISTWRGRYSRARS
jgi:hypothetical protein